MSTLGIQEKSGRIRIVLVAGGTAAAYIFNFNTPAKARIRATV
jgi:hypothetical protein